METLFSGQIGTSDFISVIRFELKSLKRVDNQLLKWSIHYCVHKIDKIFALSKKIMGLILIKVALQSNKKVTYCLDLALLWWNAVSPKVCRLFTKSAETFTKV